MAAKKTKKKTVPTRKTYGVGLPYVDLKELQGKLIVIEGTDGVGRSIQMDLLKKWLEGRGHGVRITGLTRSDLAGEAITRAKEGHTLSRLTRDLFYATDFADLYERQIITALKAGFVVLADRYIYTLIARAEVRGSDPEWIRNILEFALIPDVAFYLDIDIQTLTERVMDNRQFDYWESGMDLSPYSELYDSFQRYQKALLERFNTMTKEFKFIKLNAAKSPMQIHKELRSKLLPYLKPKK